MIFVCEHWCNSCFVNIDKFLLKSDVGCVLFYLNFFSLLTVESTVVTVESTAMTIESTVAEGTEYWHPILSFRWIRKDWSQLVIFTGWSRCAKACTK